MQKGKLNIFDNIKDYISEWTCSFLQNEEKSS